MCSWMLVVWCVGSGLKLSHLSYTMLPDRFMRIVARIIYVLLALAVILGFDYTYDSILTEGLLELGGDCLF